MNVIVEPRAAKYLGKLNEPDKSRIKTALARLGKEPPEGDIKSMTGARGYRLRIGGYRALFDVIDGNVVVHDIGPRGQIYKGRR